MARIAGNLATTSTSSALARASKMTRIWFSLIFFCPESFSSESRIPKADSGPGLFSGTVFFINVMGIASDNGLIGL
jgi:hypothetical protein